MLFEDTLVFIIELEILCVDLQVDIRVIFFSYLGFVVLSHHELSGSFHSLFREIDGLDGVLHLHFHLGFCFLE